MNYFLPGGDVVPADLQVHEEIGTGRKFVELPKMGVAYVTPEVPERNGRTELLRDLRNGAWLDAQEFDPLNYSIPRIVPEGLSILAGAPKIGKSWLLLQWSLALAAGGKALGRVDVGTRRPTLYLALEDGDRRLQDRCRRLLRGGEIPEGWERLLRVEPGLVLATLEAWFVQHGHDRPLVALDTLGKVTPPALAGETTYGRDYRVGSKLKELVDNYPGSSLVINHHDRKAAAADFVDTVSGTYGTAGACDTVLVLVRARHETTGVLKVTGRDVHEDEYALEFADGSDWKLDGKTLEESAETARLNRVTAGLSDRSAEVAAIVLAREETRAADVAKALDLDTNTVSTYLSRLADSGRIVRKARGVYGPPL